MQTYRHYKRLSRAQRGAPALSAGETLRLGSCASTQVSPLSPTLPLLVEPTLSLLDFTASFRIRLQAYAALKRFPISAPSGHPDQHRSAPRGMLQVDCLYRG